MVTELLWFLKGDTNIKYLVDNGCNIWNGDAYKAYKTKYGYDDIDCPLSMGEFITKIKTDNEFAEENGDLGPIYGTQWREWNYTDIDQISNLINELKTNPDSRRLMVSAWNVGDLPHMVLPPCHYGFQVYTRELTSQERFDYGYEKVKRETGLDDVRVELNMDALPKRAISLMWNQRSVDTFLGLPFNIASYGLLLEIIAKEVNMVPDELIGNLGDTHLYLNHIEQAKEQIGRKPFKLPQLEINEVDVLKGEVELDLKNYIYHPTIKAPLSN